MYRQLKGAFKVDRFIFTPIKSDLLNHGAIDQYETIDEALEKCVGQRIFLEATGEKSLFDIPDGDIVLIIGNTNENNLKQSQESERYSIAAPCRSDLYGVNAAAIALASMVKLNGIN